MKKEIIHISYSRPKMRAKLFYEAGSPLRPKIIENKKRYSRKEKHKVSFFN
jgi:hypothetical protein